MTRAGAGRSRRDAPPAAGRDRAAFTRQPPWQALQPVTLANCELQRYGEAHDGGYRCVPTCTWRLFGESCG